MAMPLANLLAAGTALAVLLAILAAPAPATASQLNVYELPGCQGEFDPYFNGQPCRPVTKNGSFRFYYNQDWPAYLYEDSKNCSGSTNNILTQDVPCTDEFQYESVIIEQTQSFTDEELIQLPVATAKGKK